MRSRVIGPIVPAVIRNGSLGIGQFPASDGVGGDSTKADGGEGQRAPEARSPAPLARERSSDAAACVGWVKPPGGSGTNGTRTGRATGGPESGTSAHRVSRASPRAMTASARAGCRARCGRAAHASTWAASRSLPRRSRWD